VLEERDARFMAMLATHQMQKTVLNQTAEEATILKAENEHLRVESAEKAEQIRSAQEEIARMVDSWKERDHNERMREKATQVTTADLCETCLSILRIHYAKLLPDHIRTWRAS
jgi:regulator of replication initiation timing